MTLRRRLNLLSRGDLDALSLGINVTVLRWAVIILVSLIVAARVAVSGIVSWVGLVVTHCGRMLVGSATGVCFLPPRCMALCLYLASTISSAVWPARGLRSACCPLLSERTVQKAVLRGPGKQRTGLALWNESCGIWRIRSDADMPGEFQLSAH